MFYRIEENKSRVYAYGMVEKDKENPPGLIYYGTN